jgi:hypothetical protein
LSITKEFTLADEITHAGAEITLNGISFDYESLNEAAKIQVSNLNYVDQQIAQKNNELQVADSARIVYSSVLSAELRKLT